MIDPTSVAFDIDGVIADTMRLFLDIARHEFNIGHIRYADITCYNLEDCINLERSVIDAIVARILDGNYRPSLKPIAGASRVLTRIGRRCSPVLFVTARPYPGPISDWIANLLPLDRRSIEVIATGSHENKADILLQREVFYFVDDRLETCFYLHKAGIQPVLFKQPWNRRPHPFIEVSSWSELESLIRF